MVNGSSAVEQTVVSRSVAGSNPVPGSHTPAKTASIWPVVALAVGVLLTVLWATLLTCGAYVVGSVVIERINAD
jgi:hypothetical protein